MASGTVNVSQELGNSERVRGAFKHTVQYTQYLCGCEHDFAKHARTLETTVYLLFPNMVWCMAVRVKKSPDWWDSLFNRYLSTCSAGTIAFSSCLTALKR